VHEPARRSSCSVHGGRPNAVILRLPVLASHGGTLEGQVQSDHVFVSVARKLMNITCNKILLQTLERHWCQHFVKTHVSSCCDRSPRANGSGLC